MASLLGPSANGIFTLTTPLQGIFQILSAGGLPPAIAKYISEYNGLNEEDLARQTVFTALKIMVLLGLFFGFVMIAFVAPWLAYEFYRKPIALLPLQAVGLITPFSVIVGGFRGAFQGYYGLVGAALATSIASFAMTVPMFLIQFKLTKTKPPYKFLFKVLVASLIMIIPSLLLPNDSLGLILGLIICPIIYVAMIVLLRAFDCEEIKGFKRFSHKLGPLENYFNNFLEIIINFYE